MQSAEFAPTIVLAKGEGSVAFGAYVSPETVDEYGRVFTSAIPKDGTWRTAMSVCQKNDGDLFLLVGRGWVWEEEGNGVQHLRRQGRVGGQYTIVGSRY